MGKLALGGGNLGLLLACWTLAQAQELPTTAKPSTAKPPAPMLAAKDSSHGAQPKRTPQQQQMLLYARRGADWLARMHDPKGRFLPGYLPALQRASEGDNLPRQALAAAGLAHAARVLGEEAYAVRAAQTLLTLLEDTIVDPADKTCRIVDLPGDRLVRAAAAAHLVQAICELPQPPADLLEKAEQLTRTLAKLIQADGRIAEADVSTAGMILCALARSHRCQPAPWKPALVSKALSYYRSVWEKNRRLEAVYPLTIACVECYRSNKDRQAAAFALKIQDWLLGLQYTKLDGQRLGWFGGFMAWRDGQAVEQEPDARAGALAASLAKGVSLARELADVQRHQQYTQALEQAVQFLLSLQYTEAGTQHFAAWYRPKVVGGFHHSPTNGDLRIDHAAQAIEAILDWVEHMEP
jgi:hypothetical protein